MYKKESLTKSKSGHIGPRIGVALGGHITY